MVDQHEHRISSLEKNTVAIVDALKKMEDKFDSKLDLILFQINKIAVLEANHSNHSASLNRAFTKIEDVEEDMREMFAFKNRIEGMAKMAWILWGSVGTAVLALINKVFMGGGG